MKTHTIQKVFSHQDPKLDKRTQKDSAKALHGAVLDGKFYAALGLPAPIGDSYYPLVGTTVSNFNELLAYSNKEIQGSLNGFQGVNDEKVADEKKSKIWAEIQKLQEKFRQKLIDLERMALTYSWKWLKIVWAGIIAISGIEAVIAAKSFQLFVTNLLMSILVALLVWGALIAIAKILPKLIRMGRTAKQQILIGIGCLIVLGIVFYTLGEFRVEYLKRLGDFAEASGKEADNYMLGITPLSFMLLNLFFLSVSTLLAYFFLPTKEQQLEKDKWDETNDELKGLEGRIEYFKGEITAIDEELNFVREKRAAIIAYAKYTEEWIKTLYEKAIHAFQKENILKRADKQLPESFDRPPPELHYFYKNINL